MMTIKTFGAIRGVCEGPGEIRVENAVGSGLVSHGLAKYIGHDDDPDTPKATIMEIPSARKRRNPEPDP